MITQSVSLLSSYVSKISLICFSNNSVCYFFVLLVVYSKGKIIPNSRDHTKQTNYQLFILKKDF